MNHSIITEFNEDNQYSPARVSYSKISKSPGKEDVYISKLETRIKDLKNAIKKNKPLIDQIKAQRKFMKKICEKQKQKIDGTKLDLLKQEYEHEIELLRQERHKLQDVISVMNQEASQKARYLEEAKKQIHENYIEFLRALEEVKNQNKLYEEMLINKEKAKEEKSRMMREINEEIKSKANVERKYKEVVQEIQLYEARKKKY